MKVPALVGLAILNIALNLLFAQLFAGLEAGKLSLNQGRSLYGTVFFLPLAFLAEAKLTKRDLAVFFDCFTLLQIFNLTLGRLYCFFTGCCYGRQIPGTDLRWPTRELELLLYAALFAWFVLRLRRGKAPGLHYPIFLISYGAFRFVIEFLRYSPAPGPFHIAHLWSLIAVVAGICALSDILHRQAEKPPDKRARSRKKAGR